MGDAYLAYHDLRAFRKAQRAEFGRPCPKCVELLPKAHPSILLPQQVCRIHKYRDPRPETIEAREDE